MAETGDPEGYPESDEERPQLPTFVGNAGDRSSSVWTDDGNGSPMHDSGSPMHDSE